jgi:hypothetical protein
LDKEFPRRALNVIGKARKRGIEQQGKTSSLRLRMFTAQHIKQLADAKPFKPFRICMSDGTTYDIPNHDSAFVTRHYVEVAKDPGADGIAENLHRCAILHITRIEELQPA